MKTKSKTRKKSKAGKPKTRKKKPLAEEKNKNAVRTLVYGGAIFRYEFTDEQYKEVLAEGKLGKNFEIKRRSMVSNPVVIGKVEFQGIKDIELELEIGGIISSRPAHIVLEEAGAPEEIIDKVMKIELALHRGAHEMVDELIGNDEFDGFMGSIEGALARGGKKEK